MNRVGGGQMVQRIKKAGQEDGRGLEEETQVVGEDSRKGEENGLRETQYLEVEVAVCKTEVEATLMRDLLGVTWKKGDLREADGEEEILVAENPTRTGGVQIPTQQQHRYQTAKWHQWNPQINSSTNHRASNHKEVPCKEGGTAGPILEVEAHHPKIRTKVRAGPLAQSPKSRGAGVTPWSPVAGKNPPLSPSVAKWKSMMVLQPGETQPATTVRM